MRLVSKFKILAIFLSLSACQAGDSGLEAIHADIVLDFPTVKHVSADQLANMESPILLDIREDAEYTVSHLDNAIRVRPDIRRDELLELIGDISNKDIVLYCSVGRRSSILVERMHEKLKAEGARSVSNLENGIFGWHNDRRELVNSKGPTDQVHPYNEVWKRYVLRKDQAVYTPKDSK